MPPKKGQFPERPPTLGEALYSGKEIGTRPENHEQILKDLNLGSLIPKKETEQKLEEGEKEKKSKKIITKSITKSNEKINNNDNNNNVKSVKQLDAHIDAPIPIENPSTIKSTYILPSECEAVTNLLMDYILNRKSMLIKSILRSRIFSSLGFGLFTIIAYYKIGDYFTEYILKDGILNAIISLYNNSYFLEDFFTMLFMIGIAVVTSFSSLKFISNFLQVEADDVPKNFEKYFNVDLDKYSKININKNFNKLNKDEKEIIKIMKDNSFSIVYKGVPVAFLVCEQEESYSSIDIKIISYGIRRVYVKAELLKDLISMLFKKFITESDLTKEVSTISVDLYNFEHFDIDIFKRAGFYRKKKNNLGFILTSLLGITKDTYVFESDSIEF